MATNGFTAVDAAGAAAAVDVCDDPTLAKVGAAGTGVAGAGCAMAKATAAATTSPTRAGAMRELRATLAGRIRAGWTRRRTRPTVAMTEAVLSPSSAIIDDHHALALPATVASIACTAQW